MNRSFKENAPAWAFFSLVVIYFALVTASVYEEGMTVFALLPLLAEADLGALRWTEHSLKFILIFLAVYAGAIAMYCSSQQNRRPGPNMALPAGAMCMS